MSTAWFKDTAERALVTFVEAWLGAWIVLQDATVDQLFDGEMLTVGLVAAIASILKALAATKIGSSDSASLVPDVPAP